MSQHAPPSPGLMPVRRRKRPLVLDASRSALIPLRPLGIGEVLDAGFAVLRTNARTMMGLPLAVAGVAAVYVLGLLGLGYVLGNTGGALAQSVLVGLGALLGVLLLSMCVAWMTAVLTRASLHTLLGDGFAPDSRISWRQARAMFWPMMGLSLLMAVATAIVNSVTSFVYYVTLLPALLSSGGDSVVGPVISLILSGVVGITLYSSTYSYLTLVVPAWAVENTAMPAWIGKPLRTTNVITAFGRSITLIGLRNLPRAVAVMAAVVTIAAVVAGVIYVGVLLIAMLYGNTVGIDVLELIGSPWVLAGVYAVVLILVTSALVAFTSSVQTVLYLDLRMRREGLDLALRFDEVEVPQPSAPPVLWMPPPMAWDPHTRVRG